MTPGSDPISSRRHVNALRASLPRMSQRALSAVLAEAKKGPLPDAGRKQIRLARNDVALQETPHGTLVRDVTLRGKANPLVIQVCLPMPMLWVASACERFSQLLIDTMAAAPCSRSQPWSLIIYADEIVPGMALRQVNPRK